ncbi:MAG: TPM domain-containing protein [Microscillaceae bacterium]|nr:TPM domain-containing protein [Microscillaceae bacterium]
MILLRKKKFFNTKQERQLIEAIKEAELNTSGEIRVHVENHSKGDVYGRALQVFNELEMHKTALRNGILFYLATKDHEFAVIGDEGIHRVVGDDFWENIKNEIEIKFRVKKFVDGLVQGILKAGEQLKIHFPYQTDDRNELSNEISQGD